MTTVGTLFKYQLKGLERQNLNNCQNNPIFENKRSSNEEKQIFRIDTLNFTFKHINILDLHLLCQKLLSVKLKKSENNSL